MNRTELFAYLRAPLSNPRWSWGSVRAADGAVFLLVWQDEHKKIEGKPFTCVNASTFFGEDPTFAVTLAPQPVIANPLEEECWRRATYAMCRVLLREPNGNNNGNCRL